MPRSPPGRSPGERTGQPRARSGSICPRPHSCSSSARACALVRPTPAGKPEVLDFVNQRTLDLLRSQGQRTVHFTVHNGASLGIFVITTAEREALEAAIAPLVDRPQEDWEKYGAIRLGLPEPTFMLKFDQRLRAIVRPMPGGQPELLDLVSHETLQYFREADATRKKSAPRRATSTS